MFSTPNDPHVRNLPCAGKVAQLAQGEIDRLAKAYGGRSVPAHVTLMGGIVDNEQGIFDRAALLSSQLNVSTPVQQHANLTARQPMPGSDALDIQPSELLVAL